HLVGLPLGLGLSLLLRALLGLRRRAVHDALAMEDAALLHHEGLRRDVPLDAAAAGEVRLALRDQVALEPAGNAHVLGPDVGLDLALRGQRYVAVCVDLPLHLSVDPQGACRDDGTLELRALTDDRSEEHTSEL